MTALIRGNDVRRFVHPRFASQRSRAPQCAGAATLTRKLIGVLGMLGSDADGERAAAGLLAAKLLKSASLTWDQLIREQPIALHHDAPSSSGWRATAAFCSERAPELTPWERQFLESISARRSLSPKQHAILGKIHDKCRGRGQ